MALLPFTNAVAAQAHAHFADHDAAVDALDRDRMPGRPPEDVPKVTHRIISVSDVHVASGQHPMTGRIDVIDDFKPSHTQQFLRMLAREWVDAAPRVRLTDGREGFVSAMGKLPWKGNPWVAKEDFAKLSKAHDYTLTLNLNGDMFEFLQATVERPGLRFVDGFEDSGLAPRQTPANAIVKLNIMRAGHPELFRALALHLHLGHRIDMIPGNHDRELWNPHVWAGAVEVDGRTLEGLTGILREELAALGADVGAQDAALSRLKRLPLAVYGDKLVDHGHHEDSFNLTRRPFKELFDPTDLHDEMPMALGDYGVRDGFNALERKRPYIGDAIGNRLRFVQEALTAPKTALGLLGGYLKAALREGYDESSEADEAVRAEDARGLVDRFPELVEQLNEFRAEDDKLSADDVKDGFEAAQAAGAKPFFSAFRAGAKFFQRLPGLLKNQAGRANHFSVEYEPRFEALHEALGINEIVHGHTHVAKDQSYLTDAGRRVRYVNTHTWVDQAGRWDRASRTWKDNSRGVGVIEIGEDAQGAPWSELSLMRVVDQSGHLVPGDIIDDPEVGAAREQATAAAIFDAVAPDGVPPERKLDFTAPGSRSSPAPRTTTAPAEPGPSDLPRPGGHRSTGTRRGRPPGRGARRTPAAG